MANIFISYNRQSKAVTKVLVEDVEALGHTVWFDQELSGGQAWWDQILSMIRRCDLFVFVLDSAALNSVACKREYGYAADLQKPILPILVSEGISINLLPPALSQIEFVDYRNQDRTAALRLGRAFNAVPPPAPLPDPLPVPPEVPLSYLGSLGAKLETTSLLTFEEQSVLLFDLKRALRDPETADDTRTLLKNFRKRRDLFAGVAEEIDELFEGLRERSSTLGAPPKIERGARGEAEGEAARLTEEERQTPRGTELKQVIAQLLFRRPSFLLHADEKRKLEKGARTAAEKRKTAEVAPPKLEQATEPINREQVDSLGVTPPAVTTTRTEPLAFWSLVLGLVSLVIGLVLLLPSLVLAAAAIICGHLAVSKVQKQPDLRGRRLAIAGLLMGYVEILVFLLTIIFGIR
jgi:hypothetical protein